MGRQPPSERSLSFYIFSKKNLTEFAILGKFCMQMLEVKKQTSPESFLL
jgi:hypothetical protein